MNFSDYVESMAVSLDDLTKQRIIFSGIEYDPKYDLMTNSEIKRSLRQRVDAMIKNSRMKVALNPVGVKSFDLFFQTKKDLNQFSKKYLLGDIGIKAGITAKPPTLPDTKKDKKFLAKIGR